MGATLHEILLSVGQECYKKHCLYYMTNTERTQGISAKVLSTMKALYQIYLKF